MDMRMCDGRDRVTGCARQILAVFGALLLTMNGSSAWSAESVVKHVHMKFKDKDSEKQYLSLVSQRGQIQIQARVVSDLLVEKKAELEKFNKSLTEKFSIDPARNYEYDAKSQTISRLTVAEGDGASDAAKVTKSLHLKLKDKEQTDAFVRLAAAKKLTLDEIQSLSLIAAEKQLESKACEDALMSKFSLKAGASYEYDAKDSLIYEVPPRVPDSSKR